MPAAPVFRADLLPWENALEAAVAAERLDEVDILLLARAADGAAPDAEGDVYARLLSSPAEPDPGPVADRLAQAFLRRLPGHPSSWRAAHVLFLRAATAGDLAAMERHWGLLLRNDNAPSQRLARVAGELLWRSGLRAPALTWSERGLAIGPAEAEAWAMLAGRAWECCRADQLAAESRLGGLLSLKEALQAGDASGIQKASARLRKSAIELAGPWQELVRWADSQPARGDKSDRHGAAAVLPLSGKSAALGRRTLETLGACLLDGEQLTVRDSYSSVVLGTAALIEGGPRHVFGPLRSDGMASASLRLLRQGRVAVTPNPNALIGLPVTSTIWSVALTPEDQARSIARWAREANWPAVALLAPLNEYGDRFVDAFWPAVTAGGGWFTGIGRFKPEDTDFGPAIRNVAGLDRYDSTEKALLKKAGKEPTAIIDFDVLVIVGSPRQIGLIPAQLAYWDVVAVRLMGDSSWGAGDAARIAGVHAKGLMFVDIIGGTVSEAGQRLDACVERPSSLDMAVYEGFRLLSAWRQEPDPGHSFSPVRGLGGLVQPGPERLVQRDLGRWMLTAGGRVVWDGRDPLNPEPSAP